MNDFRTGFKVGFQALARHKGEALTYVRQSNRKRTDGGLLTLGNETTKTISKAPRRPLTRAEVSSSGGRLRIDDTAFQIHADDLEELTPREGDKIKAVSGTEVWGVLYATLSPGNVWSIYVRR